MKRGYNAILGCGMLVLVLGVICIVIEPLFTGVPFDLTDPHWGRLSHYHATVRQMRSGMSQNEVTELLKDRPFARSNSSDILLAWKSQQVTGERGEHLEVRHYLLFDERGRLTNILKKTGFDARTGAQGSNAVVESLFL